MVQIRNYIKEDYPQVRNVLELCYLIYGPGESEESLAKKIENDPESILVAEEDGRIVGTIFIIYDPFMSFLFRLGVHPDYRKRGIGKQLMSSAEQELQKRGTLEVHIIVSAQNKKLKDWYEKQDYKIGDDYTWMVKRL